MGYPQMSCSVFILLSLVVTASCAVNKTLPSGVSVSSSEFKAYKNKLPICISVKSDKDGDGIGQEFNKDCRTRTASDRTLKEKRFAQISSGEVLVGRSKSKSNKTSDQPSFLSQVADTLGDVANSQAATSYLNTKKQYHEKQERDRLAKIDAEQRRLDREREQRQAMHERQQQLEQQRRDRDAAKQRQLASSGNQIRKPVDINKSTSAYGESAIQCVKLQKVTKQVQNVVRTHAFKNICNKSIRVGYVYCDKQETNPKVACDESSNFFGAATIQPYGTKYGIGTVKLIARKQGFGGQEFYWGACTTESTIHVKRTSPGRFACIGKK